MTTVAVIQARHTSTRLPGKMLLPLCNVPVISHIIARAQSVSEIDQICVTLPEGVAQKPLADYIGTLENVHLSRGPEKNLLRRFAIAAEQTSAEIVIRLWGDCPAIDPTVIRQLIQNFHNEQTDWAYLSDQSGYPLGYECQAFRTHVLTKADREVTDAFDKEALHTFLNKYPERFSRTNIWRDDIPEQCPSELQILLDTDQDYKKLCAIFEALYPSSSLFGLSDVIKLVAQHPELF